MESLSVFSQENKTFSKFQVNFAVCPTSFDIFFQKNFKVHPLYILNFDPSNSEQNPAQKTRNFLVITEMDDKNLMFPCTLIHQSLASNVSKKANTECKTTTFKGG